MIDFDAYYEALRRRDPALDGMVFVAVKTTGIYCRPVCRVRTPFVRNVEFYPSAAAAERAGYRPCLRCRPETAPFCPAWKGTKTTVERALTLIEAGALDGRTLDARWRSALGSGRGTCRGCLPNTFMRRRCKSPSRCVSSAPNASSMRPAFQSP
jgi:AraC family transcriptional regulator, regulatory protein of adaptative response / methylated-DNA-[protein]-cysteine methyltransferase